MITALAFVPKGRARAEPVRDTPSEDELKQLQAAALARGGLEGGSSSGGDEDDDMDSDNATSDDEESAVAHAKAVAASMAAAPSPGAGGGAAVSGNALEEKFKQLDMENYDNDDDNLVTRLLQGGKTEHPGEDPYVTLAGGDEDAQDDAVKPSDLLVLAAKTEEDAASLEVWLFEASDEHGDMNAYVHHDIMLPAFPLAVAWLDFNPSEPERPGSFAAVSTFDTEIEIWDLDVIDALQPVASLGGHSGDGPGKAPERRSAKRKNKEGYKPGSHTESVLALAWNGAFRNVLASGSADHTVKAWDLAEQTCKHTLKVHKDKVQALAWNPAEPQCLLSGGFDARACVSDLRTPGASAAWECGADVEALAWSPHQPTQFVVSAESGKVLCFDTRQGAGSAAVYTLQAHDKPTTSVAFNPVVPNLLVTGSVDKTVKIWDATDNAPKLVAGQDLGVGAVFVVGVPSDAAHLIAAGGAKGEVAMWDLQFQPKLKRAYAKHFIAEAGKRADAVD